MVSNGEHATGALLNERVVKLPFRYMFLTRRLVLLSALVGECLLIVANAKQSQN